MEPTQRAAHGRKDTEGTGRGKALAPSGPSAEPLSALNDRITACRACPRLVAHREAMARVKRRAFRDEDYWGRPVPGFGDPWAKLLVIGLAPAAHGGNRTGRIFTGDRSGEWLFRAFHRAGAANQPTSISRDDGLELRGVYVAAAARCAPPDNRPTPEEISCCRPFLLEEYRILRPRALLALGAIAFQAALELLEADGVARPKPRPRFAHGALFDPGPRLPKVIASYHPSQQNTQTGRLTEAMLDAAVALALEASRAP